MEFEINDILDNKLRRPEFNRKYHRYLKEGVMMDTAPLLIFLVGKLQTRHREFLLKNAFNNNDYSMKYFEALNKFLKLCKIKSEKIIITPQILLELISHFQNAYFKLNNEDEQKEVVKLFLKTHLESLISICEDISTWDTIKDDRIVCLECADVSFLIWANTKKYITLLTQDGRFLKRIIGYDKILTIKFEDIITNSEYIPKELI